MITYRHAWTIYVAALLVGVGAVALFVRDELEAMARCAWHRIACAWMQCDEAHRC